MGVNVTVNSDTKVEELNASIISVWRKVSKDLNDFNSRKDLILSDLSSIRDYVNNTKKTLMVIKNNAEVLLQLEKTLLTYVEE